MFELTLFSLIYMINVFLNEFYFLKTNLNNINPLKIYRSIRRGE